MAETDTILDAWVHVITRDGWPQARIDAVARAAACSVDAVAEVAADRWEALRALDKRIERLALAETRCRNSAIWGASCMKPRAPIRRWHCS